MPQTRSSVVSPRVHDEFSQTQIEGAVRCELPPTVPLGKVKYGKCLNAVKSIYGRSEAGTGSLSFQEIEHRIVEGEVLRQFQADLMECWSVSFSIRTKHSV